MRDFSWKYFSMTGDVDAYLLYKQIHNGLGAEQETEEDEQVVEDPLEGLS